MRRFRGFKALVHDAVDLTTDLVREGMEATSRTVTRVTDKVEPLAGPARSVDELRRLSTSGVLGTIKLVNRTVEAVSNVGVDLADELRAPRAALGTAVPMRSDVMRSAGWIGDAALGLVNAVVGDHLHQRENGLALDMVFRIGDTYVSPDRDTLAQLLPAPSSKVVLFIHGLATTEWSWCLAADAYHGDSGTNFGTLLQRDLGYTPIWLRYNSGRHVSLNGRQLAEQLERLVDAYPVPITELVLVGHSMGGLIARSACHYGSEQSRRWTGLVRRVFCLGSPHRGAPLEKLGKLLTSVLDSIDLPGTVVPARILAGRSDGIKDLRHGSLVDEDWVGRDPEALRDDGQREVPLLPGVRYHFVSATVTSDPEHPVGKVIGDLLVRQSSSSGPVIRTDTFAVETRRFGGVMHHQLQNHPSVYEVLRRACSGDNTPAS